MIKIDQAKISEIVPKIQELAARHGIRIREGDPADGKVIYRVCEYMAEQLAMAIYLEEPDDFHKSLYTNQGKPLKREPAIEAVTFSGGVAECMRSGGEADIFRFGDAGVLLAKAILANSAFQKIRQYPAAENILATVVWAGTHTTTVSGNIIRYAREKLPW